MNKPDPAAADQKPGAPKPPSAAKLKLPSNTLAAAPGQKAAPPSDQPAPPASDAQEKLGKGLDEQRDLLAEFARVTDQLNEILASLEASTFVKRFKAASRAQMELASGINQNTLDAFGVARPRPVLQKISPEEITIVLNAQQQVLGIAAQFHQHFAGLRMPHHVRQRLLHDAIRLSRQVIGQDDNFIIAVEDAVNAGAILHVFQIPVQRRSQAKVIQHIRPQLARDVAHRLNGFIQLLEQCSELAGDGRLL